MAHVAPLGEFISDIFRTKSGTLYRHKIPGTDIEIIPTPGHAPEHCSLLVTDVNFGKVCVAQDVFWWEDGKQKTDDYEVLINQNDPFASDFEELKKSRKKVLKIAEYIIPGHGKIFKNEFFV